MILKRKSSMISSVMQHLRAAPAGTAVLILTALISVIYSVIYSVISSGVDEKAAETMVL